MTSKKMFSTHINVYQQSYTQNKRDSARQKAFKLLKQERLGDIEPIQEECQKDLKIIKKMLLYSLLISIQLLIILLLNVSFHVSHIERICFWLMVVENICAMLLFYTKQEKKEAEKYFWWIGGAGGILLAISIYYITKYINLKGKIREIEAKLNQNPGAYFLLIWQQMDKIMEVTSWDSCKAEVIELQIGEERKAYEIIERQLSEYEKERQKNMKIVKDQKTTIMGVTLGLFLGILYGNYLAFYGKINMSMAAFSRTNVFCILLCVLGVIMSQKLGKKYRQYENNQLGVPDIYQMYLIEE